MQAIIQYIVVHKQRIHFVFLIGSETCYDGMILSFEIGTKFCPKYRLATEQNFEESELPGQNFVHLSLFWFLQEFLSAGFSTREGPRDACTHAL
jgi:hypothetical protein